MTISFLFNLSKVMCNIHMAMIMLSEKENISELEDFKMVYFSFDYILKD